MCVIGPRNVCESFRSFGKFFCTKESTSDMLTLPPLRLMKLSGNAASTEERVL